MGARPEIITAAIAVFDDSGNLDEQGNKAFLKRVEPYVDDVLVAGTTAEFPALSGNERALLSRWAIELFGPERTIIHIGAPSVRQALDNMQAAKDVGATRFAAITPYYYTASQHGVLEYYQALRDAIDTELNAYIYPDVACTDVTPETLTQLQEVGLDGVKLSGLASQRVEQYRDAAPQLKLWSGNDADLPHVLKCGGAGVVSGVSGVAPTAWADLREAFVSGDQKTIDEAQKKVERLVEVLGPSINRLKYALGVLGIPAGICRVPIDQPDEQTKEEIAAVLKTSRVLS
ncbi:dihydrodipicolinate synthase family protein [Bifidobacterium sp. ESL0732]|uniref:dihydrodipicolinate synthase family protein n=1 Tax=Bifidobacterium sp. ESL0732 TaxID=2983222 RepID=UPI0023F7464B|nr:dihydrodipicolinate synthase family protein [Bifidobacterium sp. ESL0732]WEV64705.1 dihydrodipicolinate synthase family protein [Bifidobacterium sp. ESL0732]